MGGAVRCLDQIDPQAADSLDADTGHGSPGLGGAGTRAGGSDAFGTADRRVCQNLRLRCQAGFQADLCNSCG